MLDDKPTDRILRPAEDARGGAHALAPVIGLLDGVLAAGVMCALIVAAMVAAYQFAPSWVARVHGVLLAGVR